MGLVTLKGWLVCLGGSLVRLLGLRGLGLLGLGACGLRGFMGLACEPWPLVVCARSGRHWGHVYLSWSVLGFGGFFGPRLHWFILRIVTAGTFIALSRQVLLFFVALTGA